MPEFAAAPTTEQTPVIPPASSMPAFGNTEPQIQPQQFNIPTTSEPVASEPVNSEPVDSDPVDIFAPESTPATISKAMPMPETTPEPVVQENDPVESATENPLIMPEDQPVEPVIETPVFDDAPIEAPKNTFNETPTTQIPLNKKNHVKLIAIIFGALLVICGVVALVMLINQPKAPVNNPAPVVVKEAPDTSTPFKDLTNDIALDFLSAAEDYVTFFPEGYAEDDDMEILDDTQKIALFYSYDKKDNIIEALKKSPAAVIYKDSLNEDTVVINQRTFHATITLDSDAVACGEFCYGIIFDKTILNYYGEDIINPATATPIRIEHIILKKHTEKDIKKYAPIVAAIFMNGQKIYSTETKTVDGAVQYVVNSVEYADEEKTTAALKKTHFTISTATGEMLYHPDLTETNVLNML